MAEVKERWSAKDEHEAIAQKVRDLTNSTDGSEPSGKG
jgi:hypothetical protein